MNELISNGGVFRTASAKPGLLFLVVQSPGNSGRSHVENRRQRATGLRENCVLDSARKYYQICHWALAGEILLTTI